MRKPILLLPAVLAGCAMASQPPAGPQAEADLAHALRGRVAQPPVACVSLRDLGGNRTVGDAILFGGDGRRLYVNRPLAACPSLDFGHTLQVQPQAGQLCRGDIALVVDLTSGVQYGGCGLGNFTPYDRPR